MNILNNNNNTIKIKKISKRERLEGKITRNNHSKNYRIEKLKDIEYRIELLNKNRESLVLQIEELISDNKILEEKISKIPKNS